MPIEAIILSIVTFFSTLSGGIFAIKNQKYLRYILGFTAGVLLGVVAFDLLPEIYNIVRDNSLSFKSAMVALVVGFLLFHIAEKTILIHRAHETEYGKHKHPKVGQISALALSGHSLLDGVGIGLGFQVNSTVGLAVAIAVIGHDFADGLNTVNLMLVHKNKRSAALKLLLLDALAPVAGVMLTTLFTLNSKNLVLYLGFFAGFLLYIGASDILPEAHSEKSSSKTIMLTILGTICLFVVTHFT